MPSRALIPEPVCAWLRDQGIDTENIRALKLTCDEFPHPPVVEIAYLPTPDRITIEFTKEL